MRKRDTALAPFKTCPRCEGAGQVPCTGREYYQSLSEEWANSLHGKFVTIPFLANSAPGGGQDKWTRIAGLAIKRLERGGWWGLRIYVSIDDGPNWGGYRRSLQLYGYDEDHDEIGGRRLYYISKGRPQRKDVQELEISDAHPELAEIFLLTQGK